jgi:(+)-pinoresinol hydroxylase
MKVPPGVSPSDFATALKQFEDVVGKDWVFTSDEDVALYRDAYSPFWGEPEELVASAVRIWATAAPRLRIRAAWFSTSSA